MRIWSLPWLLLVVTGTCLGLSLPLGRMAAAAGVPAVTWALVVSSGTVVFLLPVFLAGGRFRALDVQRWRYFATTAAVSYALPNVLVFTVIPKLGAGYAGIMYALSPICTLLFAVALRLRRPNGLAIAGLLAGLAGALLVAASRGGLDRPAAPLWIGLALLVPVLLAAGNVYRSLDWPAGASPVELAVGSHGVAVLLLAALAVGLNGGLGLSALATVPGLTLFQAVAAATMFAFYFRLQQVGGPIYLSQISYVAAAIGLGFGTLLFGEHYPPMSWVGAGLICAGVVLTTLGQRS